MNRITFLLIFMLLSLPLCAQKDKEAKDILDKASVAFKNAGGINLRFNFTGYAKNGNRNNTEQGEIQIKGNKFVLNTNHSTTWFDGRTQWSYLKASDEVNISNPTPEELQHINPYSLIQIYQQGYNYQYGGIKTIKEQQGYQLILTPLNKNSEIAKITLLVSKEYRPLSIKVEQKDLSKSEITVTSYKTGEKYSDTLFKFNKRNYPNVEVVDLR